jgi:hypothetical protein
LPLATSKLDSLALTELANPDPCGALLCSALLCSAAKKIAAPDDTRFLPSAARARASNFGRL